MILEVELLYCNLKNAENANFFSSKIITNNLTLNNVK